MSQDVLAVLQQYLTNGGKSINVPPAISNAFGSAIGTAIQELFSGGIQVNGGTDARGDRAAGEHLPDRSQPLR